MSTTFDRAFAIVLDKEGGYSNHSWDNGGETRFGISKARYPNEDIRNLTVERAKELYRRDFWDRFYCGEMPWPISLVFFDCVVNHAPGNPIRWLQNAVGSTPDGSIGPRTLGAVRACRDPVKAAAEMTKRRIDYVKGLADYPKAGKGWHNRYVDVLVEAVRA